MNELNKKLDEAVLAGKLLKTSRENIGRVLDEDCQPVCRESIAELANRGLWDELNDRFFRTLAFGTGGLRGRTIGRHVTAAENGTPTPLGRPQFPCTGTNAMNTGNVTRATLGLIAYLKEWLSSGPQQAIPRIAIAHDTRHFSREFAELTARLAVEQGCDAVLFESPRSTPELSFAVRHTGSHAGIVLTASHNPPHDNGYKVYFVDGAQIVEPHASGIIAKVNAITGSVAPLPENQRGRLITVGSEIDEAYMKRLESLILDPSMVAAQKSRLRIVFTPIHGTGGVIIKQMLSRLGFNFSVVGAQDAFDGRFPTVKSPNPENAEALDMALSLANETGADLVMGTDPDSDRLGVAVRTRSGEMRLLTGNQLAALIAAYRVTRMFSMGILTPENAHRAVLIKTIVTTDLIKAIAEKHGLRCVETLTGFKYIGQKLGKYEQALPETVRAHYRTLLETETRKTRLEHSSFYVFGGEESYGYSGGDFVRDKDANGSALMFAEVAAYASSREMTLDELLDEVYSQYGFYLEKNGSLTFEGADGAAKIATLSTSYAMRPPEKILSEPVVKVTNFDTDTVVDCDGEALPREKALIFELSNGWKVAVRPSGTEPKIKYYMFAVQKNRSGASLTRDEIAKIRENATRRLDELWDWLRLDAEERTA